MFTPGGQLDLHTFAGVRGGKGGGTDDSTKFQSRPVVLTDPVNGKSFVQETNPYLYFQNQPGQKSAQEQLNDEIAQRQAQEKIDSDAAAAKKTQDQQTAETNFQGTRQTAYNDALAAITRQFQNQGLDPNQYLESDIKPALQREFNSIQDLDPNPSAAFVPTLGNQIIGDLTSGKRSQASAALNKIFTPSYSTDLIPDTTANDAITAILNEQFDPLSAQLTNAQKRGTLTDAGYQAALSALAQKKSAGQATLQNLGNTILSSDRGDIDTIVGSARSAAGGLGLTDTFDPNAFTSQAQSKAAQDISGFGGALRSQLGDTKFADIQDLINAGGVVQGANNPTAANPVGALGTNPDDLEAQKKRGLGSTGAF